MGGEGDHTVASVEPGGFGSVGQVSDRAGGEGGNNYYMSKVLSLCPTKQIFLYP